MKITSHISTCLKTSFILQLATAVENIPWICTVCFAADTDFVVYWFSRHNARHSQEIVTNPHVAATVAVPYALGDKAQGIQIIGHAQEIKDEKRLLKGLTTLKKRYRVSAKRFQELQEELLGGKADYGLYCIIPEQIILHDTKHFPNAPRQVYTPTPLKK